MSAALLEQLNRARVTVDRFAIELREALNGRQGLDPSQIRTMSEVLAGFQGTVQRACSLRKNAPDVDLFLSSYLASLRELKQNIDCMEVMLIGQRQALERSFRQLNAASRWSQTNSLTR